MMHGFCGTATFVNLLSILFLFFCFLKGAGAKDHHDGPDIPHQCPNVYGTPWWSVLEGASKQDPCQLLHALQASPSIGVGCCFGFADQKQPSPQGPFCGPCNGQIYNVAGACQACTLNSTAPPEQATIAGSTLPSFSSWVANDDSPPSNAIQLSQVVLPQWTNLDINNDEFNIQQVIQNASSPLILSPSTSNVSSSSTPSEPSGTVPSGSTVSSSPTGTNSLGSPTASPMAATQKASGLHVGAIAGGVIAGIVLLPLLAFCALYIVRRRRRRHVAPSSEFMPVSAPYLVFSDDDAKPPPFNPEAAWRGAPLEKVYSSDSSIFVPERRDVGRFV